MRGITFLLLLSLSLPLLSLTEIEKTVREIKILNLLNGLELSREQMKFILSKAKEAKKLREEMEAKLKPYESLYLDTLRNLKRELMKGGVIDGRLRRQVGRMQVQKKKIMRDYYDKLFKLAEEVEKNLQDYQLNALSSYKPCLIPPKEGNRIGQAENYRALERILMEIREAPESVYALKKEEWAEEIVKAGKLHSSFKIVDEEKEKERIIKIFEEARALSDVEFALEKSNLARKLKENFTVPHLSFGVKNKILNYLLAPEVIPLLEEKLRKKKTYVTSSG